MAYFCVNFDAEDIKEIQKAPIKRIHTSGAEQPEEIKKEKWRFEE